MDGAFITAGTGRMSLFHVSSRRLTRRHRTTVRFTGMRVQLLLWPAVKVGTLSETGVCPSVSSMYRPQNELWLLQNTNRKTHGAKLVHRSAWPCMVSGQNVLEAEKLTSSMSLSFHRHLGDIACVSWARWLGQSQHSSKRQLRARLSDNDTIYSHCSSAQYHRYRLVNSDSILLVFHWKLLRKSVSYMAVNIKYTLNLGWLVVGASRRLSERCASLSRQLKVQWRTNLLTYVLSRE